jgi:hypothetical protein
MATRGASSRGISDHKSYKLIDLYIRFSYSVIDKIVTIINTEEEGKVVKKMEDA